MLMKSRGHLLFFALVVVMLHPGVAQAQSLLQPRAEQGKLDLTAWDFAVQGSVQLDGEWEFFWQQLLTPADFSAPLAPAPAASRHFVQVPSTWAAQNIPGQAFTNHGYGTYRLTIDLQPEAQGRSLALAIPSIATAYTLWIDGELKDKQGTVGKSREKMTAQNFTKTVYFSPRSTQVELVLQVANFVQRKGGVWDSISLGLDEDITLAREKNIMRQVAVTGGLFIMGLYHLGLYLFRRTYTATLWFGLCCLLLGVRALFTNDFLWNRLWPTFSWELAVKAEYLSVFLATGAILLYTRSLYPRELNNNVTRFLAGLIGFICLPVIFLPARLYTEWMLPSQLILITSLAYAIFGVIRAVMAKRPGASVNVAFVALLFVAAVNDTLFYNFVIDTGDLLPWALYLLLFGQTFILAAQFSSAFKQVERLSAELMQTNKTLEQKVNERTAALVRSNEHLARVERSRRQMLANIAHEFGTPLTSLIGFMTILQEELDLPQRSQKHLQTVYSKVSLLQRLTNDLKSLSRLESGQLQLDCVLIPVKQFCDALWPKYELDVTRQGIRFIYRPLPEALVASPFYVNVDQARIDQVLNNLLTNAIAHTPPGGVITVTARLFVPFRALMLAITDTGPGIGESERPLIFGRFYKGQHTREKNLRGTGLGLAIAREIMQLHHGRLGVHSVVGGGSTFYLLLPLCERQNESVGGRDHESGDDSHC